MLLAELRAFMQENAVPDSVVPMENEILGEEDLQLICWIAVI